MIAKVIVSILSGIMLALSFPNADIGILAWIAVFPLFFVIMKSQPFHALLYGFAFGATFFAFLIYWIFSLLRTQTAMGWLISLIVFLLCVSLLSLFPSLFAYVISQAAKEYGGAAIFFIPMVWVALEFARTYFLSGFPWGIIGYTQSSFLSLIQVASISGVYGVSLLIIFCNASLAYLFLERRKRISWIPLFLTVVAIASISGWGCYSLSHEDEGKDKEISVACVQGNYGAHTDGTVSQQTILNDYVDVTKEAAEAGFQLIVWPESTSYYEICCTKGYAELLTQLCQEHGIDMVLGSVHRVKHSDHERYFNSAFHLDSEGKVPERYDKIHLVPYGEYVPIPRLLFFVKRFVEAAGDFSRGEEYVVMDYRGDPFSVLICYEVIFPDAVRAFVRRGATFFINITNDSWFGDSAAPYQHFQFLVFRAVESGRYFIRCASTGISGIVAPDGKVLARTKIFTRELLTADIMPLREHTIYSRTGDWLAIVCAIITLGLIIFLCFKGIQSKKSQKGVTNIEIGPNRTV